MQNSSVGVEEFLSPEGGREGRRRNGTGKKKREGTEGNVGEGEEWEKEGRNLRAVRGIEVYGVWFGGRGNDSQQT